MRDAGAILDGIAIELAPPNIKPVRQVARNILGSITTGDVVLDNLLGGGIRSGVVTEVVGESGSGKTQLALQVSLLVQHPLGKGGLSGSACYLTTNGVLQTTRLVEIAHANPSMATCKLDHIHTRSISSVPELRHTLSHGLPNLIRSLAEKTSLSKPLRLIIVDSMGAVFRSDTKTSSKSLFERSRELTDTTLALHRLASTFHVAVVVITEVNSIFERRMSDVSQDMESDQLLYPLQARWFSRSDNFAGEGPKEAGLGLVWANQVGIRIMMTRTGRRKHLDLGGAPYHKRRHLETPFEAKKRPQTSDEQEPTLIRRLSVIFSSFSPPRYTDFVITRSGIVSFPQAYA